MNRPIDRRDILRLLTVGSVALVSGCASRSAPSAASPASPEPGGGVRPATTPGRESFFFVQLTDTHWGYHGDANPEAAITLPKAIETINASASKPDFVVFTGDLTHTTDDANERRARLRQFKELVAGLAVEKKYFLPGEHDAALDHGEAYRESFGDPTYAFDHRGLHFVALDNVSDPAGILGAAQLEWLRTDLARVLPSTPIVVFAHRPLFDLYPAWDWMTRDGAQALALLEPFENVTVLYGHVHQEHHHATGRIQHHAGRSLVFPLPAPGSVPKKAPVAWDPAHPFQGLGTRRVLSEGGGRYALTELPVIRA